jgi:hypothetical protein
MVQCVQLIRGVDAKSSCRVLLSPITRLDSFGPISVKVWLMHRNDGCDPNFAGKFVSQQALGMVLCERIVDPLELCWQAPDGVGTRSALIKFSPSCPLHRTGMKHGAMTEDVRTFRIICNPELLSRLADCKMESAFGSSFSLNIRPSTNARLSEVVLQCSSAAEAEALAIRASILERILTETTKSGSKRGSDWKNVKVQLNGLLEKLKDAEHTEQLHEIYTELRFLPLVLK